MSSHTHLERAVMRRVYIIYTLNALFSATALASMVLVFALWGIGRGVWVARVLENAPKDMLRIPEFYTAAFIQTDIFVEVLVVTCIVSGALVLRDSFRRVRGLFFTAFA